MLQREGGVAWLGWWVGWGVAASLTGKNRGNGTLSEKKEWRGSMGVYTVFAVSEKKLDLGFEKGLVIV